MAQTCPRCGLINPASAERCDCGISFPREKHKEAGNTASNKEGRVYNQPLEPPTIRASPGQKASPPPDEKLSGSGRPSCYAASGAGAARARQPEASPVKRGGQEIQSVGGCLLYLLAFCLMLLGLLLLLASREIGTCLSYCLAGLFWAGAARAFKYGRRLMTPSAASLQKRDSRSPVLLLRAFSDDELVPPQLTHQFGDVRIGRERSFEEIVVEAVEVCGPVIAIGRPGERIRPAGAAREWLSNEQWQERVDGLINESCLVVMIIGHIKDVEDGLVWEVRKLFSTECPEKVVLLAPPLPEGDVEQRWNQYSELSGGRLRRFQGGELQITAQRTKLLQTGFGR